MAWVEDEKNMTPVLVSRIDNLDTLDTKTVHFADGESRKINQDTIDISNEDVFCDLSNFFGISEDEAEWLIMPASYEMTDISKRTVINRMLEIGERYEWELD